MFTFENPFFFFTKKYFLKVKECVSKFDMHLRATLMLSRKHPRAQLTHSQMKSVKASVSQSVSWSIGPPVPLSFRQFCPSFSISWPCLRFLFFGSFFGLLFPKKKRCSRPSIKIKVFVRLPEGMLNVWQHFRECVCGWVCAACGMCHVPHALTATIRQV